MLVKAELKIAKAATMPTALTTTSVGGAKTTNWITAGSIGEVFPSLPSALLAGGTTTIYSKYFYVNTNASDDLPDAFIWIPNAFDQPGPVGNQTMSFASDDADDDADFEAWTLGYDPSGDPIAYAEELDGTSTVTTAQTFSARHEFQARNSSSGALTALNGNVSLTANATLIGYLPKDFYSATGTVTIWLAASLNDTATIADASTAPGGSSFTRPRTFAGGLAVAGGDLTADDGQGIWTKWELPERQYPSPDCQVVTAIQGNI